MIRLKDGRLLDIMPGSLAGQPEAQALSAAISPQITQLLAFADEARTYSAIDALPDNILDVLAVELRTPAYNENMPTATKRQLVKNTLIFYMTMGTPNAVNNIIRTIFESGYIEEWPEYGGEPFHFKAYTDNPAITSQNLQDFIRALSTVKRATAWLDEVILDLATPAMTTYYGNWLWVGTLVTFDLETI